VNHSTDFRFLSLFVFAAIGMTLAPVAQASPALADAVAAFSQHPDDLVAKLDRILKIFDKQKTEADPIIETHQEELKGIRADPTLSKSEKRAKILENFKRLYLELAPFLTESQMRKLKQVSTDYGDRHFPDLGLSYQLFFPTSSVTRSVYGNSLGSFGLALEREGAEIGRRTQIGFTLDDFGIEGNGNKLFVLAPEIFCEYRLSVDRFSYAYGRLSAGPAYMDYAFNLTNGSHFAAKRLGADGALELGIRRGALRAGVDYRSFTEPGGLNFNGIQLFIQWTPIRF
jgi:hypothetical protein